MLTAIQHKYDRGDTVWRLKTSYAFGPRCPVCSTPDKTISQNTEYLCRACSGTKRNRVPCYSVTLFHITHVHILLASENLHHEKPQIEYSDASTGHRVKESELYAYREKAVQAGELYKLNFQHPQP